MYGADVYGSVPYGAGGVAAADVFDVDAMLADSRTEFVVTVVLTTWHTDTSEEHIHYYASKEWATEPDDYPASQPFEGRLTTLPSNSRSVIGDRIGINHTSGEGTIVLANADGELDEIVDTHAVDSRRVVVRFGRITDAFANHFVIFDGVAVDIFADIDAATITVRDKGLLLDVPAQPNVYAGTGGAEGGTDLKGKRKPLVLGVAFGIQPVPVDLSNLIYHVHDGSVAGDVPIPGVNLVFDRGVQLSPEGTVTTYADLVAASVTPGSYKFSTAVGMFKLGAAASGVVLAGAKRIDLGAVTTENIPAGILFLIEHTGVLADDEINHGTFDAIDDLLSGATEYVSRYIGPDDASSVADVVRGLMAGVGGWAGFSRAGKLTLGIFTAPAGNPVAYFDRDEGDIIDLNRERLPDAVWPPPWRWRVAWARNETVFTDFAGSVTESDKAFFAEPYRLAIAEDSGILTDHPLAQDSAPVEAHFGYSSPPAQAEADRLLALYSAGDNLYRMTLTQRALRLEIGDLINVTHPRFGLDAGKLLRVAAIDDRIQIEDGGGGIQVEVVAFG